MPAVCDGAALLDGSPMKAAVKFCGGCNPGYDRTEYWDSIREASVGRIEWAPLDGDGVGAILLISGCERACPRDDLSRQSCLVSVTNSSLPAAAVVSLLEACSKTNSGERKQYPFTCSGTNPPCPPLKKGGKERRFLEKAGKEATHQFPPFVKGGEGGFGKIDLTLWSMEAFLHV